MSVIQTKQKNKNALKEIASRYKKNYVIRVGFPASKTGGITYPSVRPEYDTGDSPPTVVQVAAENEFGVGVPARPFMKLSTPGAMRIAKQTFRHLGTLLNRGKMTKKKAVEIVAPLVVDVFKKTIAELSSPPNSERTVRIKKSSNPLVDTGLMRQTLTSEVKEVKGAK